jgi:hypothetical protein
VALVASKYFGDFVDDEWIDGSSAPMHLFDYAKWKATFGSANVLDADGNDNGTVDAADYSLWRNYAGYQSAWYLGPAGSGAALPIVDFGNSPKVANVTISGSASIHAPYSFDAHDGSGEQLRTVPVGGADTISITFSEDVNVAASHLRVVGLYSANVPTFAEFGMNLGVVWLLADLDGDYDVNDADSETRADNVGMSNPTWADGDLNDDNAVNLDDLDLMFAQYGLDLEVVS